MCIFLSPSFSTLYILEKLSLLAPTPLFTYTLQYFTMSLLGGIYQNTITNFRVVLLVIQVGHSYKRVGSGLGSWVLVPLTLLTKTQKKSRVYHFIIEIQFLTSNLLFQLATMDRDDKKERERNKMYTLESNISVKKCHCHLPFHLSNTMYLSRLKIAFVKEKMCLMQNAISWI